MNPQQRPELREQLAKQIMGWHVQIIAWAYSGQAPLWHAEDGTPLIPCHTWRPDEDDRQLMQVLNEMIERGFSCEIVMDRSLTRARFSAPRSGASKAWEDPDRRVAILRAALAAVDAQLDGCS